MKKYILFILLCFMMTGCAVSAHKGVLDVDSESQLKLRQMQTRYFDTDDKQKTLEAVMETLQDLGFIIDKASFELGSVTATKLDGYYLRMTVNVLPKEGGRISVRASAQYNITPITDPEPYQQFFESLSKSLFLQAHLEE